MKKTQLKKIKEFYTALTWRLIKAGKKVPDEYNLILDLIEELEGGSKHVRTRKYKIS